MLVNIGTTIKEAMGKRNNMTAHRLAALANIPVEDVERAINDDRRLEVLARIFDALGIQVAVLYMPEGRE